MACDLLFAAGYHTPLLGADVPQEDIALAVADHRADVVAITPTSPTAPSGSTRRSTICAAPLATTRSCSAAAGCRSRSPRPGAPPCARTSRLVVETTDALVHHAPLN